MLWIFRKISDRIQTLLIADSALCLESEFLTRHADRKAQLLVKAREYEEQGLENLAEELRGQVRELSVEKPLSSVLPALTNLHHETVEAEPAKRESPAAARNNLVANNGSNTKKASRRKAR